MRFVDTNVLLYAISRDDDELEKAERAGDLLTARDLAVSAQVLGEFYVQATRPSRPDPLNHDQAARLVDSFARFPVQPLTASIVKGAIAASRRFTISYWDAAIIEAARAAGCDVVLSEDLNDTQDYDGVRVLNPFV